MAATAVVLLLGRRDRVDRYLRPYAGSRATHLYPAGPSKPGFAPTKYLPQPWTAEQIDQFDALQTIAVVHRPLQINYRKDQSNKPLGDTKQPVKLMPSQARQSVFREKFEAILQSVPDCKPARILYDTGGPATGAHVIPLSLTISAVLPELEFGDPEETIDISMRIGNTGAASPLALWALAALMCNDKKNVAMTVNLRQAEEATLTIVAPAAQPSYFRSTAQVPVTATSSAPVHSPPMVPHVAIGTRLRTEDECPQSGYWQCAPADMIAGDRHYIRAGQSFPPVREKRTLSVMEKMMNESPIDVKSASWALVSYD